MSGTIPPDTGCQLITALSIRLKDQETDELFRRIRELQAERAPKSVE